MFTKRQISVVAASFLTMAVVLTGCGGGGSSSNAPTASSSSPAPVIKTVRVSDGYVLNATVQCKDTNGNVLAIFHSVPQEGGTYEGDISNGGCPVLYAKDGYIDANANGIVESGEAKAPLMTAPGNYSNINPFTMLIQNGVTPQEIVRAFNLPENTNFDVAIPQASADIKKAAATLSILLSYVQSQQNATVRSALPSLPGTGNAASSTPAAASSTPAAASSTPAAASSTPAVSPTTNQLTLEGLIVSIRNNTLSDFISQLPSDIHSVVTSIEESDETTNYDEVIRPILASLNGVANAGTGQTSSSSVPSVPGSGNLPTLPTTGSGTQNSSNIGDILYSPGTVGTSSSTPSNTSSSANNPNLPPLPPASSSSTGNDMPPPPPSSSSSTGNDMPPPPPSAGSSSSSSSSSNGGGTPPPLPPAPGGPSTP